VKRGMISKPQLDLKKEEHEDAVMKEYAEEAKVWEAHDQAWANEKWSF